MEPRPPAEVQTYYSRYPEESRLEIGPFRLEFERTKEILTRVLPRPPARIVDVGGAAGAYSFWLAEQRYGAGSDRVGLRAETSEVDTGGHKP